MRAASRAGLGLTAAILRDKILHNLQDRIDPAPVTLERFYLTGVKAGKEHLEGTYEV
jgi:hypothetical protein